MNREQKAAIDRISEHIVAQMYHYIEGSNLSLEEIRAFCRDCQALQENGGCATASDKGSAARWRGRKNCGKATVNGVRAQMTENGFEPFVS